jgi:hypothetical protein
VSSLLTLVGDQRIAGSGSLRGFVFFLPSELSGIARSWRPAAFADRTWRCIPLFSLEYLDTAQCISDYRDSVYSRSTI